jgi:transketolase
MLPHMTVIVPADAEEARKAVIAAAKHVGPVYLRFGRAATPLFTTAESPFAIGKALTLWKSAAAKVAILSTGSLSYQALLAARSLESDGIGSIVLHLPTVKPLDEEAIVAAARATGRVVTIEEHQAAGGFGSAVAECLAQNASVPMRIMGMQDEFGQSGEPEQLLEHYRLDAAAIAHEAASLVRGRAIL